MVELYLVDWSWTVHLIAEGSRAQSCILEECCMNLNIVRENLQQSAQLHDRISAWIVHCQECD